MRSLDYRQTVRDVGRRIAELRAAKGLTQEALAEELGIAPKYLGRIERGLQNLSVRTLVRFANHFDVAPEELFAAPQTREVRVGRPPKNDG